MQSALVAPSLEQLHSELSHKDRWIRTAVGRHLVRVCPNDARLLPTILDMTERFGPRANDELLRLVQELELDPDSFQRLLKMLPSATGRWGQGIRVLICRAPDALLQPILREILALPIWTARERERLENRREIGNCSSDDIWTELGDLADKEREQDLSCRDQDLFDDLVLKLARYNQLPTDQLVSLVRQPKSHAPLLVAAAARILSLRGERSTAHDLLQLIAHEDPTIAMEAAYALNRVADEQMIEAILNLKSNSIPFLTAKAAALEGWHDPKASAGLGKLAAEGRDDIEDTVELWLAACSSFDPAQVRAALAFASTLDPDASELFLAGELIPYLDLLGITTPDRGRWLKIRREEEDAILRGEERDWVIYSDEDDQKAEDDEDEEDDQGDEDDRS